MKKSMVIVGVVAAALSLVAMTSCELEMGDDGERVATISYSDFVKDKNCTYIGDCSGETFVKDMSISADKGLTLSFGIPAALTDDDQYLLFTNNTKQFGMTNGYLWPWTSEFSNGKGVNDSYLTGARTLMTKCVANSLYTITFSSEGSIYFYIDGNLIGNGWTEASVADAAVWEGIKQFCQHMLDAATSDGLLLMPTDVKQLEVSEMKDVLYAEALTPEIVKALYECWKTKK